MKRNNLLIGFLLAIAIWGISACTSTGPLTKCPDMKPTQEKQVVFKKKNRKDAKPYISTKVAKKTTNTQTNTPLLSSKSPTPNTLKYKEWGETNNSLTPRTLATTALAIPITVEEKESSIKNELKDFIQTKKAAIVANQAVSKKAFKVKKKEIRHAMKAAKVVNKKNFFSMSRAGFLLIVLAVLIPPLAMFIYDEGLSYRFWLSLILTIIGFVPGMIYTLVIILND